MAALTPVDATLSIGARIGRYFAIVSMIPSLFLVLWVYLLVASGSLTGTPTWHKVEVAISDWSLGKVAWVVLATLAVAVVLHPLQFVTTQLLEGYWGTTSLAIAAMKIRIVHHRKRQRRIAGVCASSADPGDVDDHGLRRVSRDSPVVLALARHARIGFR